MNNSNNIIKLFEMTVRKYPDKAAIISEYTECSFKELREKAKKIANRIKKLDISDRPIPLLINRDMETLICLFAILYSGNYYVPVDIELKDEKLQMILEEIDSRIVVCSEKIEDKVNKKTCDRYIVINSNVNVEDDEITDVVYSDYLNIVYTSGSTGKPKGVLKTQYAMIDYLNHFQDNFHISSEEIIGNQTPFFFDASAKDIFLMAVSGCSLVIIPAEKFIFPNRLVEYLNEKKVSYICWVPSAISIVIQMNTFKKIIPNYLKYVFFVGEAMPMKYLKKWYEVLPKIEYVNLYGSTEMAGVVCYRKLSDEDFCREEIPIGKAFDGYSIFVLDEDGESSSEGELIIVSDNLAEGYYKDYTKTQEKFITLVVDGVNKKALRTGDIVCCYNNELFFKSRKDYQIKHMGRRIELGEIENAATKISDIIKSCCVYDSKKHHIMLFCEIQESSKMTEKDVVVELRKLLSDYMIPNKVIFMDKLPINANGKIDRQKLNETI